MKTINRLEAYVKLIKTKGKIFTAFFFKKDNSLRKMNCRLGVKKYLKGGELKYKPLDKMLLGVFEMSSKSYKMINLNTLTKIVVDKTEYDVI
jgi:hypothetical protein